MTIDAPAKRAYLLVESQVGHTSERFLGDGLALARFGSRVCLFLVADAVSAAVRGASPVLDSLIAAGGEVWVDDFTLAQRALPPGVLAAGVTVVSMAQVAATLTEKSTTVVWH